MCVYIRACVCESVCACVCACACVHVCMFQTWPSYICNHPLDLRQVIFSPLLFNKALYTKHAQIINVYTLPNKLFSYNQPCTRGTSLGDHILLACIYRSLCNVTSSVLYIVNYVLLVSLLRAKFHKFTDMHYNVYSGFIFRRGIFMGDLLLCFIGKTLHCVNFT